MDIAVIGAGSIGGTLAKAWMGAGHRVYLGVRDTTAGNVRELLKLGERISAHSVADAARAAGVILVAVQAAATRDVVDHLGNASGKIILDAMNSVQTRAGEYASTAEALRAWTGSPDVIKCFNCVGYNVMANPAFGGTAADMFMAGSSARGKEVARQLAADAGFPECYDLGGDEQIPLLESLARLWIDLAMFQGLGREIAFKLLRR
jgi:8-hydroxy-5-deazaflavin:NADPH oxidoreductase